MTNWLKRAAADSGSPIPSGAAGATPASRAFRALPAIVFLFSLLLVYGALIPAMHDIGGWDEAAHVNSGRLIVEQGGMPLLADSPLTTCLYGLAYLLFRGSIFWLMYSVWFGRFISFSLLWLSVFLLGRRLRRYAHPLVFAGLFLVAPFMIDLLIFPSDPLFAGCAALALWQFLGFVETRKARQLAWSSLFAGMAVLARPEGVVLSLVFLGLSAAVGWHAKSMRTSLPAAVLPLLVLVGGYVVTRGLLTGDYDTGLAGRAYANFETGHALVYQGPGQMDHEVETHLEAARVYGTAEENGNSVLRAISRRPDIYLQRLVAAAKAAPQVVLRAYGIRFGVVLFLLALRGMIELFRQRDRLLLGVLVAWMAPVATGLALTVLRPGHMLLPFYILLALAAVGVSAFPDDMRRNPSRVAWIGVLLGFGLYGVLDSKLAITYGVGVSLMTLVLVWLAIPRIRDPQALHRTALLLLFCGGLIIHGSFPSPVVRSPGSEPLEQSLAYLTEHYPRGEPLASGWPGIAWAARMTYIGLVDDDVPIRSSPREFLVWMADQGVRAVYVDRSLFADNPAVWSLISAELDDGLETVFVTDGGDIQIAEIRIEP